MTLQGEGPFRGKPAFFIRLAKCNLACSFCDTFFDDGDWMTFDQIEDAIEETINEYFGGEVPEYARNTYEEEGPDGLGVYSCVRDMVLVITGGEPMLQANLGPFLERMSHQFRDTQIESNGTLVQDIPDSTTLVVSPKCAEKHGKPTKYLAPKAEMLSRANCLKFVMSADQDSPYATIPDWAHEWAYQTGGEIFISPMNIYNSQPQASKKMRAETNQIEIAERSTVDEVISFWEPGLLDMEANRKNHEYVAAYCIRHGFTFNMQQHLFASVA
jgi:organic radical activating enzyme